MYPRRPKSKRNPSSDKDVFQRRLEGKRQRRTRSVDGLVNAQETGHDIIDIINSTHEAEHVAMEDGATFVEIADKGVDESDDDCHSVPSSVASGPSLSYYTRPTQEWCSSCQELYQKARGLKAVIKNKVLDNGECTDTPVMFMWEYFLQHVHKKEKRNDCTDNINYYIKTGIRERNV